MLDSCYQFLRKFKPTPVGSWSETFELAARWGLLPDRSLNPLTRNSRRYWSQSDEDGIIEKILGRVAIEAESRTFLELGVGDGSENNTLALLASKWSGVWIGAENLRFTPCVGGRLVFKKDWISVENVAQLAKGGFSELGVPASPSIVSVDLDGNDFHVVKTLIDAGIHPSIWVVEYNARFPTSAEWVMPYNLQHTWDSRDDYFGASLLSWTNLFDSFGYFLVACSATGANAFYVNNTFRERFLDCPKAVEELYQPPLYATAPVWAHKASARTLRSLTAPLSDAVLYGRGTASDG